MSTWFETDVRDALVGFARNNGLDVDEAKRMVAELNGTAPRKEQVVKGCSDCDVAGKCKGCGGTGRCACWKTAGGLGCDECATETRGACGDGCLGTGLCSAYPKSPELKANTIVGR